MENTGLIDLAPAPHGFRFDARRGGIVDIYLPKQDHVAVRLHLTPVPKYTYYSPGGWQVGFDEIGLRPYEFSRDLMISTFKRGTGVEILPHGVTAALIRAVGRAADMDLGSYNPQRDAEIEVDA